MPVLRGQYFRTEHFRAVPWAAEPLGPSPTTGVAVRATAPRLVSSLHSTPKVPVVLLAAMPSLVGADATTPEVPVHVVATAPSLTAAATSRPKVPVVAVGTMPSLTGSCVSTPKVRVACLATAPSLTAALTSRPKVPVAAAVTMPSLAAACASTPKVRVACSGTMPSLTAAAASTPKVPVACTGTMPSLTAAATTVFKPTHLSGCVLWLRSDLGVTTSTGVSSWADQSGNANTATQATGAKQPTYNASGGGTQSRPYLTFDGANFFLQCADAASIDLTTASMFCALSNITQPTVADGSFGGTGAWAMCKGASSVAFNYDLAIGHNATSHAGDLMICSYNNILHFSDQAGGTTVSITYGSSTVDCLTCVMTPSSGTNVTTFRRNGTANAASSGGILQNTAQKLCIGAKQVGATPTISNWLQAKMYEIALYNVALSSAQLAVLEQYVTSRYN